LKSIDGHGLFKLKYTASFVALVAANLIPIAGVLYAGWDASDIVVLYWCENLVVGGYNVLMLVFAHDPTAKFWQKLIVIAFFSVHFGGFCFGHGLILIRFFHLGNIWGHVIRAMLWPVAGLVLSHGVSFVENYLMRREYATASLQKLFFRPYGRIAITHIAIVTSALAVNALHSPLGLLITLIALKTVLDAYFHWRLHRLSPGSNGQDVSAD